MASEAQEIRAELAKIARKYGPDNSFVGKVTQVQDNVCTLEREGVVKNGVILSLGISSSISLRPKVQKQALALRIGSSEQWVLIWCEESTSVVVGLDFNTLIELGETRLRVVRNSYEIELDNQGIAIGQTAFNGETLGKVLTSLVDALNALTVVDPVSGLLPVSPASVTQLNAVKAKINLFLK